MQVAERTAPKDVVFSTFESEASLPDIMALVEKDLSEPYSVFTYRYFVLGWPALTILAREASDSKLLGVIVCKADRQNRRKRLRGYIAMLAVEKEHRKRGIGSYLAYQAILKMKEMGCDEVVLETELSNSGALSLYGKLGFTRDKRLCRYYLNGGDAFRLKLWFTSPSWNDAPPANEPSEQAPPVTANQVEVDSSNNNNAKQTHKDEEEETKPSSSAPAATTVSAASSNKKKGKKKN